MFDGIHNLVGGLVAIFYFKYLGHWEQISQFDGIHILGIIILIDFHIFQRGGPGPPTSNVLVSIASWNDWPASVLCLGMGPADQVRGFGHLFWGDKNHLGILRAW